MKKILLFLMFSFLVSSQKSLSDSVRTPEISSIGLLQRSMAQYVELKHKTPTSWSDLIDSGLFPDLYLEQTMRFLPGFEKNYRFPASELFINVMGKRERVIAMAINKETQRQWDKKIFNPDRRLIFVQIDDGYIVSRRYHESYLERMFKESGLDLSDYTGPSGNWFPVASLPPASTKDTSSKPARDLKPGSDAIRQNPIQAPDENSSDNRFLIPAGIVFLLLMVFGWLKLKKPKT